MRLSKKRRAQVVELLRCTVWECQRERNAGLYGVARQLGLRTWDQRGHGVWKAARDARLSIDAGLLMDYADSCLEAAQLVEDGDWP